MLSLIFSVLFQQVYKNPYTNLGNSSKICQISTSKGNYRVYPFTFSMLAAVEERCAKGASVGDLSDPIYPQLSWLLFEHPNQLGSVISTDFSRRKWIKLKGERRKNCCFFGHARTSMADLEVSQIVCPPCSPS